jgi:hypothetical protein
MSKLSEAMALMAGHEDSEGVAEFVLDTFRGRGKHDCGHGPMTVAEAREVMRSWVHDRCSEFEMDKSEFNELRT